MTQGDQNMNMQSTKDYLKQYRHIRTKIRLLEEDIGMIEAGIGSIPATRDKDMPRSVSARNSVEDRLVRLVDLKRDKETMIHEAMIKAAEISGAIEDLAHIDDVNASTYMLLLFDRYIMLMPWDEVADELNFTESHTRGFLHRKALEAIEPIVTGKLNQI